MVSTCRRCLPAAAAAGRSSTSAAAATSPDGSFAGTVSTSLDPELLRDVPRRPGGGRTGAGHHHAARGRRDPLALAAAAGCTRLALHRDSPVMTLIRGGQTRGGTRGVSSVDQRQRLLTFTKVGDYPVYLGTGHGHERDPAPLARRDVVAGGVRPAAAAGAVPGRAHRTSAAPARRSTRRTGSARRRWRGAGWRSRCCSRRSSRRWAA